MQKLYKKQKINDIRIEYCTLQIIGAKIDFPSNKQTNKNIKKTTVK